MSDVVEPGREWRRAFLASLVGSAAFLFVASLVAGLPWTAATVATLAVGAVALALLAALVLAGRPFHPLRRLEIREDGLSLERAGDVRDIPRAAILDLRPGALLLEGGERIGLPPAALVRLRSLFRTALLERVRERGRVYRHEREPASWTVRLARGYLAVCGAALLVIVGSAAFRAGPFGPLVAAAIGLAAWWAVTRTLAVRREGLARAAGLATVTLDREGIEVTEREGETTRLAWGEIEDVPPPGRSGPVLVETADLDHVLPRSFHPSLARDLRAVWDELGEPASDPERGEADRQSSSDSRFDR